MSEGGEKIWKSRQPLYIDSAMAKSEAPIEKLSDFGVKQMLYRVDIALCVHRKRCTVKFKSNNGS